MITPLLHFIAPETGFKLQRDGNGILESFLFDFQENKKMLPS